MSAFVRTPRAVCSSCTGVFEVAGGLIQTVRSHSRTMPMPMQLMRINWPITKRCLTTTTTTRGSKQRFPSPNKKSSISPGQQKRISRIERPRGLRVAETIGPYGLKRVDYSQPPPHWPLPIHPPARKNDKSKYVSLFLVTCFFGFAILIYFNQDEEVYEYWRQVEQGNVPIDIDDDEDDDDDYDDDDDDAED